MVIEQKLRIFRLISILEGISFLVLLFLAMPLKYLFDSPAMVANVGMAHGILFIAYVAGALYLFRPMPWNMKTLAIIIFCSVLPFGPFYVEKKYL